MLFPTKTFSSLINDLLFFPLLISKEMLNYLQGKKKRRK